MISTFVVSGLDHFNVTAAQSMLQCIVYTSEVSVSLHLMQCVCVCVCREFLREIKSKNHDKRSEMILSTALLVVGPI